ncbi:MAG: FKBP-type peptidyl-prolyl cis-trans isomerase [Ferruginibacter sp.]|nr:FKBP-type peptidyl-prolyl cis-trans isomerase [Chitinophagaceae bacterium]
MNTIKNLLWMLFAGIILVSCNKAEYKKSKGGMPYQLFKGKDKDTQQIKAGNFIKIEFTQKIHDSVYFTTVGALPQYRQVNVVADPYDISELWTSLKVGDSLITTQMIDTFIKRNPQNIPPQFKKGMKIISYVKILGVFPSDTAARADYENENKKWMASEIATIEKYLADKKITAQKTPSGAMVEIIKPGTGNLIDSGNYISVNYTGTSWSGKKFDSNTDSAFQHVGPYPFVAGAGAMIKGFDEAVQLMRMGSTARVYIPSVLAYAGNPTSPLIKPYENLIFEIEIVDVKDKMPPQPDMRGMQPQVPGVNTPQPNK